MLSSEVITDRLLLRRCREADLNAYCELIYRSADVMRTLPGGAVAAPEKAYGRARSNLMESWNTDGVGPWLVEDNKSANLLGHCGLRYWPGTADIEVLYALDSQAWGQGFATEAAIASVNAGFAELSLERIIAGVFPDNRRSVRVLEKLGMRFTAERSFAGRVAHMYELCRPDWPDCFASSV